MFFEEEKNEESEQTFSKLGSGDKIEKNVDEGEKIGEKLDASTYLSKTRFDSLSGCLSAATLSAVKEMGFTYMTEIQAKCISPLLEVRVFFSIWFFDFFS